MEWYVYRHDVNRQKMVDFNIFNHGGFIKDVKDALEEYDNKEEFAVRLERLLSYYFHYKSEWEIIISPWVGGRDTKDTKIDAYHQVMNNWNVFIDYVWSFKEKYNE